MPMDRNLSCCRLTRRRFLQSAAAFVGGGLPLASATESADAKREGEADAAAADLVPPTNLIDIHTHMTQRWGEHAPLGAKGMLKWMDAHGVEKAVILPLINPESWEYPITTDHVLDQTKGHRDRLLPFCSIDPRTPNLGSAARMAGLLKRYIDAGAVGFGEHKPGVAIDDERNLRLFEACANVGLPVLLHIDNKRNFDQPGLPGLEKVLTRFPDLPFIGHAQGWWASISGDVKKKQMQHYPDGEVAPGGAIDRLMDKHENIYGDMSAGSGHNALSRDLAFTRKFLRRRADRILFGTDYLRPGQAIPQFQLLRETLDLPEDVQAKIARGNARRLLSLG